MIHKLFKVLVPRYLNYTTSLTSMRLLPAVDIDWNNLESRKYVKQRVIIELKGNPYPKIDQDEMQSNTFLHNILLSYAAKDFNKKKVQADAITLDTK